MFRKPFKPPLLHRRPSEADASAIGHSRSSEGQPPPKKLRTNSSGTEGDTPVFVDKKSELKPFKAPTLLQRRYHSTDSRIATPSDTPSSVSSTKTSAQFESRAVTDRKPLRTISNGFSISSEGEHGPKAPLRTKPRVEDAHGKQTYPNLEKGSKPNESSDGNATMDSYYIVLWRKPTNKKHKTWDGDGVLSVINGIAKLQDVSGRELGRSASKLTGPLLPESRLSIAGKEVEIDSVISRTGFLAGEPFLGTYAPGKHENDEKLKAQFKLAKEDKSMEDSETKKKKRNMPMSKGKEKNQEAKNLPSSTQEGIQPAITVSKAPASVFKPPLLQVQQSDYRHWQSVTGAPQLGNTRILSPRHDPSAPGALVMPRPSSESVPKGKHIVDVVVDPLLTKHLRPHQRDGVQFLYECVMGMKGDEGRGAILADAMGLGKTLQTIALVWTLLKQNPLYDERDTQVSPVVKKVLIICPAGLVANWRKEFRKWLGLDRIGIFVVDKNARLTDFTMGKAYNVMIIGYEMLRNVQDELKKGAPIDLIVADEGHRLKTAQNKSLLAIKSFDTDRRILLTGTLLQNALKEMYETVDLINPGLLGKYNAFKRDFEIPILRSQQPEATKKETEKGDDRKEELQLLTGKFMLRRTADVLAKYLPPKTEIVLFCKPTGAQAEMYKAVLRSPIYGAVLGSSETSFQLINVLKKLCNSPSLLAMTADVDEEGKQSDMINALVASLPAKQQARHGPSSSTKLQFLDTLLHKLRQNTDEKIVIVSHYTTTLDMIQRLITSLSYPFLRLDGKVPTSKRQSLVDQFNNAPAKRCFCFLLSTKAGGVGLNLIGASRLVLFDVDWNPAHDQQAMARIHRDGQQRPCFIYRLVVAGTLEEKVYQRQVTKIGLSDAVVDAKKTVQAFSSEELRRLFMFEEGNECATHELLNCDCGGDGNEKALRESVDSHKDLEAEQLEENRDEEEDEDEDLPSLGVLISASKLDVEKQEELIRKMREKSLTGKKKTRNQMLALMQHLHIDVTKLRDEHDSIESLVEDNVLLESLKDPQNMVKFIFSKTTG